MKLTIIGASGHGRVVVDIAALCGYDDIEFLDDDGRLKSCGRYPVIGTVCRAKEIENDLFVAVGDAAARRRIMESFGDRRMPVLVHPSAVVSDSVEIGDGSVVMAGTVVNPGVRTGRGCIVNTSSSIDHDCTIGDFVHVSVGVHLCGNVKVGEDTWVGAGATVSNNVSICGGCMIGAGAVVVNDIKEKGTYIGMPAKLMNKVLKTEWGWVFFSRVGLGRMLHSSLWQHRRAA